MNKIKYAESYARCEKSKRRSLARKYHEKEVEALRFMFNANRASSPDDKRNLYRQAFIAWNRYALIGRGDGPFWS